MDLAAELRRYGPEGTAPTPSRAEAVRYCADLAATHYENFRVVSWLTPRAIRPHFASIYGFCRWADDLADEAGDREKSRKLLEWWRGEIARLYRGEASHPVMIALRETTREFAIPITPFENLLAAFEQDQEVLEYQDFDQLLAYCRRSANPVGHLVLFLARSFTPENAELSDLTCTALQLANFWQDVGRDLDIGRIYLPREDRDRFGVSEADLRAKRFTPAFRDLLEFEVDRTRTLFDLGKPLVSRLPRPFNFDVDLFRRGGLAICDRIERQGYDVFRKRPKLTKFDQVGLMLKAWLRIPNDPHPRLIPFEQGA